jgi:hypothetical protein
MQENRIFKLKLLRWDPSKELSPWNCIVLTDEEADVHRMLPDPQSSYGDAFLARIHQKHLLARTKFVVLERHVARARQQLQAQQRVKALPERLPRNKLIADTTEVSHA